jgi:cytoskeletal protein RodZ
MINAAVALNWVIPAELIGDRLRDARQNHGLSLRALGDRAGLSASFHSLVELDQACDWPDLPVSKNLQGK